MGWEVATVASGDGAGTYTSIALDAQERPLISYYETATGNLMLAAWNGADWGAPDLLDGAGDDVGKFTSLKLDSQGNPHIAYYDETNGDLKYIYHDGAAWQSPQIVAEAGDVGRYCSLDLDSQDRPHVVYYDQTNGELEYLYWDGANWQGGTIETVGQVSESSGSEVHRLASLALDSTDTPHVSFYDNSSEGELKYAVWNGVDDWDIATVQSEGDAGADNSLVLDGMDRPHISYFIYVSDGGRFKGNLGYAYYDGQWHNDTAVESPTTFSAGKHNAIALDASGNPAISFYNVNNRDLWFVRWNGTNWVQSVVDDEASTGPYNDLAFDSQGLAHISYAKVLDADPRLKYALAAQSDLAVTVNYPVQLDLVPGDRTTVPIVVTNSGNSALSGLATLNLYHSDDQAVGGDDLLLTREVRINLDAGESATYNLRYQIPMDAQPETFYFVGGLVDGTGLAEDVLDNNVVVAAHPAEVVWKFGVVDGRRIKLRIYDADDDLVTFSLAGGGWGEVSGGTNFEQVTAHETTDRSTVKIATRRGAQTSVGQIVVEGPLRGLDARMTNLRGDLEVQQGLRSLRLHNLTGGNTITLNSSDATLDARLKVAILFTQTQGVVNLLSNKLAIRSLTVDDWDSELNSITAPSMGKFSVREGNASGDLTLTGDGSRFVLGTTRIKGDLDDAVWTLTGDVGTMRVYGPAVDNWTLTANSLRSLKANSLVSTNIDVEDALYGLQALQWNGGGLEAGSVGTLKIKGDRQGIAGNLTGIDLTVTGNGVEAGRRALGSLYVRGQVENSTLIVQGDAGSVDVGRLNASSLRMGITTLTGNIADFGGNEFFLRSLRLRGVDESGVPRFFDNDSTLGVWEIGSFRLGSTAPEDMNGKVEFFEIYRSNFEYDPADYPDLTVYDLMP
jgi:hypothetical protein